LRKQRVLYGVEVEMEMTKGYVKEGKEDEGKKGDDDDVTSAYQPIGLMES
jgi:hypothetical protein